VQASRIACASATVKTRGSFFRAFKEISRPRYGFPLLDCHRQPAARPAHPPPALRPGRPGLLPVLGAAGHPATMTFFITIAGRRWPAEETFKTGKDILGWNQCQART
jgi:hypothetical protein